MHSFLTLAGLGFGKGLGLETLRRVAYQQDRSCEVSTSLNCAWTLQGEGAKAAEQVAVARREAELAAESIRARAVEETQAKAVRIECVNALATKPALCRHLAVLSHP